MLLHFTLFFVRQISVFFKLLPSCGLSAATKYLISATEFLRKIPLLYPCYFF